MASHTVKAYSFGPLRKSPKAEITWTLLLSLSCLFLSSCASHGGPNRTSPPPQPTSNPAETKRVDCWVPYRVEYDKPFLVDVSLIDPENSSEQSEVVMKSPGVTYKRSKFRLRPGEHEYVDATAKRKMSGLVLIFGFSQGYENCDVVVDADYAGHLKASTIQLPYKQPRSLTIQIVDKDEKPLKAEAALEMEIQSEDATIGSPKGPTHVVDEPILASSTSSRPFLLTSTNWRGGPVRVLATLKIRDGSALAQNTFSLDADPWFWLPMGLAIGGALLYGIYHLVSDPDWTTNPKSKITSKVLASILAGLIAYLFADFDLLGLKLDPHVLRTYAILGFLFSYIGIDLVLSKRFRSGSKG